MDYQVEEHPRGLIVRARGRVDETNWEAFAEALRDFASRAADRAVESMVLDLAGVDYMSSRGLRALTLAQRAAKQLGIALVLAAPNPHMREILAISRYDKVFPVVDTVEAAFAD